MNAASIIAHKSDGVGWMTFSHPGRHNALTDTMCLEVLEALADFSADPAVRLCVMKGAGDKAFVSGADIGGLKAGARSGDAAPPTLRAFEALGAFDKPLVAMIRGWCLGGGLAIAMKADMRICASDACFGIPAARLGVGYPTDSMRDLVTLVGPAAAKSILFTAGRLSSAQALRLGLVDEVVEPEALGEAVAGVARAIVENAPLTIRAAKLTIDHIVRGSPDSDAVAGALSACYASADFAEGRAAFIEKRRPQFKGS
jgi:enoyl-CoA hydratase/carnithine racemase